MRKLIPIGINILQKIRYSAQFSIINSVEMANNYKKPGKHTQAFIMKQAGLTPNHFNRSLSNLRKINQGYFNYDKNSKTVESDWKLWNKKEASLKVPSHLIGKLNRNDLLVLLYLQVTQYHDKNNSFKSGAKKLVEKANAYFKRKNWNLKLDLSSTYTSLAKLKEHYLINYQKANWMKKGIKDGRSIYFKFIKNIIVTPLGWGELTEVKKVTMFPTDNLKNTSNDDPPDNKEQSNNDWGHLEELIKENN